MSRLMTDLAGGFATLIFLWSVVTLLGTVG
jgi:hypothetical protein